MLYSRSLSLSILNIAMCKKFSVIFACSVSQSCPTLLRPHELQPARLLCPWNSPGENAAVGCYPSNKSSWPGDQTHVSALAGGFFTTEPPGKPLPFYFSLLGLSGPQPLNGPFWRRTLSLWLSYSFQSLLESFHDACSRIYYQHSDLKIESTQ